jgi:hypothetical protein
VISGASLDQSYGGGTIWGKAGLALHEVNFAVPCKFLAPTQTPTEADTIETVFHTVLQPSFSRSVEP